MKAPLAAVVLLASFALVTPAVVLHAQDHAVLADPLPEQLVKLQGTWVGKENGRPGRCHLSVKGSAISFVGADKDEWYKAIAIVTAGVEPAQLSGKITECADDKLVGKAALSIFKFDESGQLTIVAHPPGAAEAPKSFDGDPEARTFVFHKAE